MNNGAEEAASVAPGKFIPTFAVKYGSKEGWPPVEEDARHWLALGCRFVAVGSDVGLLARHSEALAAKFQPR